MNYQEWMNQHLLTDGNMPTHWSTWQAAKRQALERAAEICDEHAAQHLKYGDINEAAALEDASTSIRALIEQDGASRGEKT